MPLRINIDRDREWRNEKNNLHREDGPAVEEADGCKSWWVNGKRHKVDGPAVEYVSGLKMWYLDGKLHRVDGPALEWLDGTREWWINGIQTTKEKFDEVKNR